MALEDVAFFDAVIRFVGLSDEESFDLFTEVLEVMVLPEDIVAIDLSDGVSLSEPAAVERPRPGLRLEEEAATREDSPVPASPRPR